MTRLAAALACDVRLQARQGFYAAAAFVLVVAVAIFRLFPADVLVWGLPIVVLANVQTNAFYFISGLVLLEKTEGSLEARVVTPLRDAELLGSKVATLTALSLAENVLLVVATWGAGFDLLALFAGVTLSSVLFALAGLATVVRYDSVNAFLMPSFVVVSALSLPLLPYFGLAESPLFDLHPLQAPLRLIATSIDPAAPGPSWTALAATAGWAAAGAALALRSHRRFVVARAGGRP